MRTIIINNTALLAALLLPAVLLARPALADASHEYVVSVDENLRELEVTAQFGSAVHSIAARSAKASQFIFDLHECASKHPLRTRGRRVVVPAAGLTCIRYRVDLAGAARAERRNAGLSASNVIVSPAVWLWRPPQVDDITVHFESNGAIGVSVPWTPVDNEPRSFRIVPSPESASAASVFGDFKYFETSIPGAVLRITIATTEDKTDADNIVDWVSTAAHNVTLAYGSFPNPSPSVVVLPDGGARSGDSAVRFGRVVRDGGETIEFFINSDMPVESFYDDWTATHEFSHLMLPYLNNRHRWISEGFAQYYQNVLLARAGQYSDSRAWQKLYEGLERGRNSSPELSPNTAAAGNRRGSTMKVYWSGAALALMADVELRTRSGGDQSLDTVLKTLSDCCLPAPDMWSGPQLFQQLDAFLDEPLFMPLYRRYAEATGFPEVRPLLSRLGVLVGTGQIRLDDDAELSAVRRAITGP